MGHGTTAAAAAIPNSVVVVQGECKVSDRPGAELTTLLGSCIATCMWDPVVGVGGMNHFLLPYSRPGSPSSERYGLYAMEILINSLLKLGAKKTRMKAKVFGGARMGESFNMIGQKIADFALSFLEAEGIPCIAKSVGGLMARRLRYFPSTGDARQIFVRESPLSGAFQNSQEPSTEDIQFFDGNAR